MAFTEDLSVFLDLNGPGVPVVAGAVSGVGILDLLPNSELILGGEINVIDYLLTVPTATFGDLGYGSTVIVDGQTYKAKTAPMSFDDGVFCRVPLIPIPTAVVTPLAGRILRTGSGLVLRSGAGRSLQAQPA
jgi:hypothetical protein